MDWTRGYVADIGYTAGFYRELAPSHMAFAALSIGRSPGRERERFRESPLDRFTQPSPSGAPLFGMPNSSRDCRSRPASRSKPRSARNKRC